MRRKITSLVAIALAKPLTPVRDITSGFFLVRREALDGVTLDPIGFKIGLEVIAKGTMTERPSRSRTSSPTASPASRS